VYGSYSYTMHCEAGILAKRSFGVRIKLELFSGACEIRDILCIYFLSSMQEVSLLKWFMKEHVTSTTYPPKAEPVRRLTFL
jgi:hypothetical protein